ncbi:MAG: hypothetical protein IJ848_03920 [Alphaproteobacteria bacterium]|nr:hypothetical protein [Alphaproteobacteria bacterium]
MNNIKQLKPILLLLLFNNCEVKAVEYCIKNGLVNLNCNNSQSQVNDTKDETIDETIIEGQYSKLFDIVNKSSNDDLDDILEQEQTQLNDDTYDTFGEENNYDNKSIEVMNKTKKVRTECSKFIEKQKAKLHSIKNSVPENFVHKVVQSINTKINPIYEQENEIDSSDDVSNDINNEIQFDEKLIKNNKTNGLTKIILPKNNPLMNFHINHNIMQLNNTEIKIKFDIKQQHNNKKWYDKLDKDSATVFRKNINCNTNNEYVEKFTNLSFYSMEKDKVKYSNTFLQNLSEYSSDDEYLMDIKSILSQAVIQKYLENFFRYKNITNLNKVIEVLNNIKYKHNSKSSQNDSYKLSCEVISLTLFNYNSLEKIYNDIYNGKYDENQNGVNEFLRLITNQLLLKLYFIVHGNNKISELECIYKILLNRSKNAILNQNINSIKNDLVNILYEIDIHNNEDIEDINKIISNIIEALW